MNKIINKILIILLLAIACYNFYSVSKLSEKIKLIEKNLDEYTKIGWMGSEAVKKVKQSVVRIVGGESEGSGFAISEGGFIMTNYHVIEFEPSPKVIFPDNTFEVGSVILTDKEADLAVVKVGRNLPVVSFADVNELVPADELISIGFPLGGDIVGEASISKGLFSAVRKSKKINVDYIQTDMTIVSGMSGGPVINTGGEVVGVSTMGLANGGLGLAISANTVKDRWFKMTSSEEYQSDIERIEFKPNESPLEAVQAFYNYLKARKLEKAFELLSDNFVMGYSFEHWQRGYKPLLDTSIVAIYLDFTIKDRVKVKLSTKDFVDDEIIYKYFEGYWDVRKIDGKFLLWDPEIRKVDDPDEDWFDPNVTFLKELEEFRKSHKDVDDLADDIKALMKNPENDDLNIKELYDLAKKQTAEAETL